MSSFKRQSFLERTSAIAADAKLVHERRIQQGADFIAAHSPQPDQVAAYHAAKAEAIRRGEPTWEKEASDEQDVSIFWYAKDGHRVGFVFVEPDGAARICIETNGENPLIVDVINRRSPEENTIEAVERLEAIVAPETED